MIGVFLTKRNQDEGGGKTITDEIFFSFIKKLNRNNNKFIFLISNDTNNFYVKELKKKNLIYTKINENNLSKKILIYLCHLSEVCNLIIHKFNLLKLNNFFKEKNCKIIWFLSSEYREPINVPYIATVWDLQFKTHPQFKEVGSFFKKLFKNLVHVNFIKNSNKVITGTIVGKKEILKLIGFKKKILILPHPVSETFLKKKKNNKIKNNNILFKKKFFLYPANFWKHKNHNNLIKAYYKFQLKYHNYNLVLTGKQENDFKNIVKLIQDYKLDKKIFIMNYVNLNYLIDLYDNCHAVIYVPFSGPENLPPLEAMARKKILINSLYKGAFEQLKRHPIYVNPNSIESICNGMKKSINEKFNKKIIEAHNYVKLKSSKNYIKSIINELTEY